MRPDYKQLNRVTEHVHSNATVALVTYNDLAFGWPYAGINKKDALWRQEHLRGAISGFYKFYSRYLVFRT